MKRATEALIRPKSTDFDNDRPHNAHKQVIFDPYGVLFNNLGEKLL